MKKLIIFILAFVVTFSNCLAEGSRSSEVNFTSMNDPSLLPFMRDRIYQAVLDNLNSDDYFVENIQAIYISDEYLEELAFNSQTNIYFGYSLAELEQQFQGQKYYFTLGETNVTTVKAWEPYDDPMEKIIKNVAIGTGVILICVTLASATSVAAPAVSAIFAVAAKTGTACALSSGGIATATTGMIEYFKTGDFDEAMKQALLRGSEEYKFGAIFGTISGGAAEAVFLKGATLHGLTMNEAALIQRESGYPLGVIKEFHSMDEYEIYKKAGLAKNTVNNASALTRYIDLQQVDTFGKTNLERMLAGNAPLDPQGVAYELHHVGQQNDSILAILTQSEHRGEGNFGMLHELMRGSEVDHGAAFAALKKEFWKSFATLQ